MKASYILVISIVFALSTYAQSAETNNQFLPGQPVYDTNGDIVNAHGGAILFQNGKYFWFGEKRGVSASEGVNVYSSTDLSHWNFEGLALSPVYDDAQSDIAKGCVMERPKVLYNEKTKQYTLWFHLELKGQGYAAARVAVAVSDKITGPYQFVRSFRPNGNMSRDMTVYKDDDGLAYLIYSSRENYDLRITQLTDDYLFVTTKDKMLFSNHREAPAIFKYQNLYYLITSGCTGWDPNKASIHTAKNLWGDWTESTTNPMIGLNWEKTFNAQSTYVLPVAGTKHQFIFLADRWNSRNLKDSRYIFLPINLNTEIPTIQWMDKWNLNWFQQSVSKH